MKKIIVSLLLAGLAAVAFVQGYTLAPDSERWPDGPVSFQSYFDGDEAERAVAAAVRGWQEPVGGLLQLGVAAGHGDVIAGNQVSELGWDALPPEVVSLTRIVSRSGLIHEADVSVSRAAAAGSDWSLAAILTHEIGHTLGLGHADDGGQGVHAAMSSAPGSTSATLAFDDEAGLAEAYRPGDLQARVRGGLTPQDVAFPPRNEPFAFRLQLEGVYRDQLRAGQTTTFVNPEGSVIWTQEYLRYRVNGCDHAVATFRVFEQIQGRGIQPICVDFTGTSVAFPPRNEPFAFRQQLETLYRDVLRAAAIQTFVNPEGDVIWTQEYIRYRLNGCSHGQATDRVLVQVGGGGVQPVCALPTTTLTGTVSQPTPSGSTPLAGVTVSVPAQGKSTTTDSNGRFSLAGLARGSFTVTFTRQGFNDRSLSLNLNEDTVTVFVDMLPTAVANPSVRLTLAYVCNPTCTGDPDNYALNVDCGGGSCTVFRTADATRSGVVTATVTMAPGVHNVELVSRSASWTLTVTSASSGSGGMVPGSWRILSSAGGGVLVGACGMSGNASEALLEFTVTGAGSSTC